MGDRKGKALAQELMDDLLNEGSEDARSPAKGKAPNSKMPSPPQGTTVQPSPPVAHAESDANEIELDHTVDLGIPDEHEVLSANNEPLFPNDATVPLSDEERARPAQIPSSPQPAPTAKIPSEQPDYRPRTSVGRYGALRQSGAPSATEAALAQSESLRIAQNRILDLEQEIERLRLQNEQLGAAGETLRRRADELLAENQKREGDYQHAVSTFAQEKDFLSTTKETLQRELEGVRRKNEELELRISTQIQKIRVRERELENRLELVKMESAALIRSKDEIILDLKRQMDQISLELSNYRNKNQELNRLTTDKQEMLRRTVKALRLALSMLEGEEDAPKAAPTPQRKAK